MSERTDPVAVARHALNAYPPDDLAAQTGQAAYRVVEALKCAGLLSPLTPEEAEALTVVLERIEIRRSWDNTLVMYPALDSAKEKLRVLAAQREGGDDG